MKDSIHLVFEYCAVDLATLIDRMFVGYFFFVIYYVNNHILLI